MRRYKRYLINEAVDVPRSSKFYRLQTEDAVQRVPADFQHNPDENVQRGINAIPDNEVSM